MPWFVFSLLLFHSFDKSRSHGAALMDWKGQNKNFMMFVFFGAIISKFLFSAWRWICKYCASMHFSMIFMIEWLINNHKNDTIRWEMWVFPTTKKSMRKCIVLDDMWNELKLSERRNWIVYKQIAYGSVLSISEIE